MIPLCHDAGEDRQRSQKLLIQLMVLRIVLWAGLEAGGLAKRATLSAEIGSLSAKIEPVRLLCCPEGLARIPQSKRYAQAISRLGKERARWI